MVAMVNFSYLENGMYAESPYNKVNEFTIGANLLILKGIHYV